MITLLDTDAALHALAPQWTALWRRAGSPPFQSPDWLLPWWDAFGTGRPRVAASWSGGALTGLLPMYLLDEGAERKLLPLGVGITDYQDALLDPALPPGAADALLHAALARGDGATSCALPDLPPGAALRGAALPAGWTETALPDTPCPVLTLADGVPAGTLRNVRQARHRAGRQGPWSAGVARPEEACAAWDELLRLHDARWTAQGQPGGVLGDPAVRAFHAAAIPRLAASGTLRVQTVRFGARAVAAYHTLAAPDGLYFYLSGFDAAEAFVSPGTLLLGHVVEQAVRDGVRALHFLRGGEPYKYAWGAKDRWNSGRLLRPTP